MVLVRSRCCQKLHLIADNLGWFGEGAQNIESILHEKGRDVARSLDTELLEFDESALEAPPNPLEGHLTKGARAVE